MEGEKKIEDRRNGTHTRTKERMKKRTKRRK